VKLTRSSTSVIVALLAVALAGIAVVQALSWRHVRRLAEEAFRANVHAALADTVDRLEAAELERKVVDLYVPESAAATAPFALLVPRSDGVPATGPAELPAGGKGFRLPVSSTGRTLVVDLSQPQRLRITRVGPPPQEIVSETRLPGRHEFPLPDCPTRRPCEYRLEVGDLPHRVLVADGRIARITLVAPRSSQLFALVQKTLEQSMTGQPPPIGLRVDPATVEGTLRASLAERGVSAQFGFGIVRDKGRRVEMARPETVRAELGRTPFRVRLFPRDPRPGADELAVVFPGARLSRETPAVTWAIVSGIFIAVTVGCFTVVLRLAAAQRAFTSRLTDFVNTLAHEFKTPLSTVTLAGDAMADAAGRGNAEGVAKFRRVIADECCRLRIQVERILEVASLERRGPAGLSLTRVDLHDVVRAALEHFEPRVAARQGRIEAALGAGRHHVIGDEVHLLNVLHNLLDNALKYTARPPAIRVTTANAARKVRLAVEDNGIGIPPGQERRIFEPFYRAPRRGGHDVRGFGIGLSYVARVVAGHAGSVRARNVDGGGAVFEIDLPVAPQAPGEGTTSDDAS